MSLPDTLFLSALSLLVVALGAFCVLVVMSGLRRSEGSDRSARPGISARPGSAGRPVRLWGVANTLRALELRPGDPAYATRWAFYLHRITGVGVLGFLTLHIVDVSLFAFSTRLYDRVHSLYATPELRVLECGLVFAVLFHALNGLRILAVDGWNLSARASRIALVPVTVLSVVAGIISSVLILAPVL